MLENSDRTCRPRRRKLQAAITTTTTLIRRSVLRTRSWERGGELSIRLRRSETPYAKNTVLMMASKNVCTEMNTACVEEEKKIPVAAVDTRLYDAAQAKKDPRQSTAKTEA